MTDGQTDGQTDDIEFIGPPKGVQKEFRVNLYPLTVHEDTYFYTLHGDRGGWYHPPLEKHTSTINMNLKFRTHIHTHK